WRPSCRCRPALLPPDGPPSCSSPSTPRAAARCTKRKRRPPQRICASQLSHHFDHHAFLPLPIELSVEHLFPRSQVQLTPSDGDNHLVPHERPLQMGVGVVFTRLVVAIRQPGGRELLQPFLKVVNQAIFPVVHVDRRRDV